MSNSTTYDVSFNNTDASIVLPNDVPAPTLGFLGDVDCRTWEVVLTHPALPRPIATDISAATQEEAFAIWAKYSYISARFYAERFRALSV